MALIAGPITGIDDPAEAIVMAFQAIQQTLTPEHIQVTPADPPQDIDGPLWRWTLVDDAPQVQIQDPEIAVFDGHVERGHWSPTTPATHPQIRSGLVVTTEHGMVVVAVHQGDEDDDINELIEAAMAHVAAIEGD